MSNGRVKHRLMHYRMACPTLSRTPFNMLICQTTSLISSKWVQNETKRSGLVQSKNSQDDGKGTTRNLTTLTTPHLTQRNHQQAQLQDITALLPWIIQYSNKERLHLRKGSNNGKEGYACTVGIQDILWQAALGS
jgi:hypothetical protein